MIGWSGSYPLNGTNFPSLSLMRPPTLGLVTVSSDGASLQTARPRGACTAAVWVLMEEGCPAGAGGRRPGVPPEAVEVGVPVCVMLCGLNFARAFGVLL